MLRLIATPGNRQDLIGAFDLVDGFSGRTILADKAYDSNEFREFLDECGLKGCIPPRRTDPIQGHSIEGITNIAAMSRILPAYQRGTCHRYQTRKTRYPILSSCYLGFSL
tara:strand:- start:3792 stop:4121 length:330 start_codon:yes stop_codon:yes gene_type:complete